MAVTLGATEITITGPDISEELARDVRADVDGRLAQIVADLAHDYPGLTFGFGDVQLGGPATCVYCHQPVTRHPDSMIVDGDNIAACGPSPTGTHELG